MIADENFQAFLKLLQDYPQCIAPHKADLNRLLATLPTEIEDITRTLIRWCKERNLYDTFLDCLDDAQRGPGGSSNMGVTDPRDLLENAIRRATTNDRQTTNPPQS